MSVNIRGRHFLKLLDYTPAEIRYLLDLAKNFKDLKRAGTPHRYLEGKNIVLLFEKTSTRTRCSFEVAGMDLGMGVTYLDPGSSQMGKKESISDTAHVLGRMYDGIEYRGFSQKIVEELAENAGVPDADARRPSDDRGEEGLAQGPAFHLFRRRAQQHGQLSHGRLREDGSALHGLRAEGAVPGGGAGGACKRVCGTKRRLRDAHGIH